MTTSHDTFSFNDCISCECLGMIWPVFRAISKKNSRFLLDTYRLFENVRDQLLEGAKELQVAGPFRVAGPDPRSVDQPASKCRSSRDCISCSNSPSLLQ